MHPPLTITPLLSPHLPDHAWRDAVEHLRAALGGADNPSLLPPHFLKSPFRRIGGQIFTAHRGEELAGAAFLLPRAWLPPDGCSYTLRWHPHPQADAEESRRSAAQALDQVAARLAPAPVILFDPQAAHAFQPTHRLEAGLDIGRPSQEEAEAMRRLQQRVWGVGAEYLYPADIHTPDFGLGASLAARDAATGELVGALFGFFKWSEAGLPSPWAARVQARFRLESQSLAVEPAWRGRGVAFHLKARQAQDARAAGVDLVEWTTDPLLFANAALNFGKLKAVCTRFYPDLLPFRNLLNQLPASRLVMTLAVASPRVQEALAHPGPAVLPLGDVGKVVQVNQGWGHLRFHVDAPQIALEIPADWAGLQNRDLGAAQAWRESTDQLLAHYVGLQPGQFILTTPARQGDRCFLIGQRAEGWVDGLVDGLIG